MDQEVCNLLTEWDMPELIPNFKAEKIDLAAFNLLEATTIRLLCPTIGEFAKFLSKYNVRKEVLKVVDQLDADEEVEVDKVTEQVVPPNEVVDDVTINPTESIQDAIQEIAAKRQRTDVINPLNLDSFLKSTLNGLAVLAEYNAKSGLDSNARTSLVTLIVDGMLAIKTSFSAEAFLNQAKEIVKLFPKEEVETYYVKSAVFIGKDKKKKYISARGKLYEKYHNVRKYYVRIGLIEKSKGVLVDDDVVDDIADGKAHLVWLNNSTETWPEVVTHWEGCRQYRRNQKFEVSKLYDEIPALKQPVGYTLIESDFKEIYPGQENFLIEGFAQLLDKVSKAVEKKEIDNVKHLLSNESSLNQKVYGVIIALCHLMPSPVITTNVIKANKSKLMKPSVLESINGVALLVEDANDIASVIEDRNRKYIELGIPLQPFIIGVGSILDNITGSYICVGTHYYRVTNLLKALEVCFKSYYAFNISYQLESLTFWYFMQRYIFKIDTKKDKVPSRVLTLISSFK